MAANAYDRAAHAEALASFKEKCKAQDDLIEERQLMVRTAAETQGVTP